jgi:hypothetical protein
MHQYIFSLANTGSANDSSWIAFAIQRCNRSIRLWRESSNNPTDPGVALVTCLLFICFETLHGAAASTAMHIQQGYKLLKSLEEQQGRDGRSRFVDPASIRPVLGNLELSASSVQTDTWQDRRHLRSHQCLEYLG